MSGRRFELPRPFGALFRRLFPTAMGAEACEDLRSEYASLRERHGRLTLLPWCLFQLLRPSTWELAWKLRGVTASTSPATSGRRDAAGSARASAPPYLLGGWWLDVKLGWRMLRRYPVLTLIGVLSIAVAVGASAGFFAVSQNLLDPTLPIPEGDRLVGIQTWNVATNQPVIFVLYDFGVWRDELESVEEVGAFSPFQPNLILEDGRSVSIPGSRITAAAFGNARVSPLMGRPILEADEEAGAADVAVIGFDVWRDLFGGDPGVIGRVVRIGATPHTIVGVMPRGFRFPYADDLWVPLRADPSAVEPLQGPFVTVMARLRDGVGIEEAQAELTVLGRRMAADHPDTHESLRPRVEGYAQSLYMGPTLQFSVGRAVLLILLLVVCANVGALVYARNAARMPEVSVRRALGASRGRILVQLFIEAVLLSTIGALIGIAFVRWGMRALAEVAAGALPGGTVRLPFYWQWELAPETLIYIGAATVLCAVVAGLLPAVKLTREPSGKSLRQAGRGGIAPPFGRMAKAAIALQVGLSVGLLAVAAGQLPTLITISEASVPGVSSEQYLTMRLEPADVADASVFGAAIIGVWDVARALKTRLVLEPEVRSVTLASALPGMSHPQQLVEIEGDARIEPLAARVARVETEFFEGLGAPIAEGRPFDSGDLASDGSAQPVVIVNRSFARRAAGEANVLGQRVRFLRPGADPGPWLEIVGVAEDLGMSFSDPESPQGLYVPLTYDALPVSMAVRVGAEGASFEPRLRSLAAATDPTVRLIGVRTLDAVLEAVRTRERWSYLGILLATLATMALSLSGVYAVTSFFVVQRTREIGIRVALGANSRQIAFGVASRALVPALVGTVLGGALSVALTSTLGLRLVIAIGVSVAMLGAVLLACVGPLRRAIAMHPTEAIQTGV